MKLPLFAFLFCICTVALAQSPASADSVFVLGAVRAPSMLAYEPGLTLYGAIYRLGGTVDFTATPIHLIRDGVIIKKTLRLDSESSPDNVPLKPKDVIYAGTILIPPR